MAWTTPRTWVPGEMVTASMLNIHLRDNMNALNPVLGSWTPILTADGGASGQTYSSQVGSYYKVGKLVVATFGMVLTAKGTLTGNLQLSGYPFAGDGNAGYMPLIWENLGVALAALYAEVGSSTLGYLRPLAAGGSTSFINQAMAAAGVTNTTILRGSLIYTASS